MTACNNTITVPQFIVVMAVEEGVTNDYIAAYMAMKQVGD
mgnify:CR=1 FL=1